MASRLNLIGKKFNLLTPIKIVGKSRYGYIWRCLCDCGNYTDVVGTEIVRGNTKSCGCYQYNAVPNGESGFKVLFRNYKNSATKRGIEFSIEFRDFVLLMSKECSYCGKSPEQKIKIHKKETIYNGIDRVDSSIGYVRGNVVSCCKVCNFAKLRMSENDFLNWIKSVYNYRHLGV